MKGHCIISFSITSRISSLAGVTFDVYAKEDIVSADGTLETEYHKAGDKETTIVTNHKGHCKN